MNLRRHEIITAFAATIFFTLSIPLIAEDSFGFGDIALDSPSLAGGAASGVVVGGTVDAGVTVFADDFDNADSAKDAALGDIFSGSLKFKAAGGNADAEIDLDVDPAADGVSPISIDEAFLRGYWGRLDVEAGLRKIVWGKADSDGPLNVINPIDYTDMTVVDSLDRRIARPLVHASWKIGSFTKLEGIFVPSFLGSQYASDGIWKPANVDNLMDDVLSSVSSIYQSAVAASLASVDVSEYYTETTGLGYAQYGLRLTTTLGSSDIGLQYYYGYLSNPAISVTGTSNIPPNIDIDVEYNRFHQIGTDYASVWGLFNLREEIALNLTEDLSGNDGAVINPFISWSLGFDRDIFAGINLNAQASGTVRLMDSEVGNTVADAEYDTDPTNTLITTKLSKGFMKDEFELKFQGIYEIEMADYYLIPGFSWSKGDTTVECDLGFFGGTSDGNLSQFSGNDYFKLTLGYSF